MRDITDRGFHAGFMKFLLPSFGQLLISAVSLTRSAVASVFSPGVGLLRRHPSANF